VHVLVFIFSLFFFFASHSGFFGLCVHVCVPFFELYIIRIFCRENAKLVSLVTPICNKLHVV
jgi:hypothetical protein